MLLAAATMLDSSTQNGTKYALPSITKFVATPTGSDIVPITFSIILSAATSPSSPWLANASISSAVRDDN